MFVLKYYINEYGQEGGYFAGIFSSWEEAADSVDHLGRDYHEYSWYEVEEVPVNVKQEVC